MDYEAAILDHQDAQEHGDWDACDRWGCWIGPDGVCDTCGERAK